MNERKIDNTCPICGGVAIMTERCIDGYSWCENDHKWKTYSVDTKNKTDWKAEYNLLLKENERLKIEFQEIDQECNRLEKCEETVLILGGKK